MFDVDKNYLFSLETMAELIVPKLMFRRIQKRDGTLVDFDKQKITDAIFAAAQSVGGKDERLAESLSDHVILYLARTYADGLLNVEQVQDAIEKMLIENGHAQTAKSFILYRAERHRVRQSKLITAPNQPASEVNPKDLQVRTSDESVIAWNRQRIIDALVRETQLDAGIAVKISKEVEEQIIYSKLRVITAGLIRELVNAKLLESGFEKERRLHTRLGIPLYDFEHLLLNRTPESANSVAQTVIAAIERQYAVAKVFSTAVVDAHAQGALYLHHLEEITKAYEFRGLVPESRTALAELISHNLFSKYRFRVPLRSALLFLSDEVNTDLSRNKINWELLVTEQDLSDQTFEKIFSALQQTLGFQELSENIFIRLINETESAKFALVIHKISLNLPRLAYLLGKERDETYLFQLLTSRLRLIADAHLQKQTLFNRLFGSRFPELLNLPSASQQRIFSIGILGLNELVQSFYGNQLNQSDSAYRAGRRILTQLNDQCQQLSQTFNLLFRIEPTDIAEISSRFAKLDLERYPAYAAQVIKRKLTNGGGTYTLGARFYEPVATFDAVPDDLSTSANTSMDKFPQILAESQLHPFLNEQVSISLPAGRKLDSSMVLDEPTGLILFLKKVFHETECHLLQIKYET